MKKLLLISSLLLISVSTLKAEDLNEIFKRTNDFVAAGNYAKALNELTWANNEIAKMHSAKIASFFPKELNGYTGADGESSNVLGMLNIEKKYSKGSETINVTLTGASGGQGGLMGGIAGVGKMAAMFGGGQTGISSFRIKGKTAMQDTNNGDNTVTIYLDSGSIISVKGYDCPAENIKKIAESLDVEGLDKYLAGQ